MKLAGKKDDHHFPKDPASALEMMMTEYGNTVLRTAYFYLRDRHLAEDVSQEVFVRAYHYWTRFRGDSRVKTWLTRITINLCKDKLQLKQTKAEEPTDPLELYHAGTKLSVEDEVLERLNETTLLKHVMKLPQHYYEVLYLYYYLDFSTKEIADATGNKEGTIRGRLHRARALLTSELGREEGVVR